jgi:ADP-ribose pyrophosphatase YjhB (NUDIX family)
MIDNEKIKYIIDQIKSYYDLKLCSDRKTIVTLTYIICKVCDVKIREKMTRDYVELNIHKFDSCEPSKSARVNTKIAFYWIDQFIFAMNHMADFHVLVKALGSACELMDRYNNNHKECVIHLTKFRLMDDLFLAALNHTRDLIPMIACNFIIPDDDIRNSIMRIKKEYGYIILGYVSENRAPTYDRPRSNLNMETMLHKLMYDLAIQDYELVRINGDFYPLDREIHNLHVIYIMSSWNEDDNFNLVDINEEERERILREKKFTDSYTLKKEHEMTEKGYVSVDVAADAVVITHSKDRPRILLVTRAKEPGAGLYALPGGHVDVNDPTLLHTAMRELEEETGLNMIDSYPSFHKPTLSSDGIIFDSIDRCDHKRIITHAFTWILDVEHDEIFVRGNDDAQDAIWVPLITVLRYFRNRMHDDHYDILAQVYKNNYKMMGWPNVIS